MILVIRISGLVKVPKKIKEILFRLRLRRKYSAILLKLNPNNQRILKKIRNYTAYGDISEDMLLKLIEKRGILRDKSKKLDAKKVISQIEKLDSKSWDIKPFFRLHPPRQGIDSKKHFGTTKKAVLGDNKNKINDLLERML